MTSLVPLCALAVFPALVVVAALRDATSYTIPNWISIAAAALFAPAALLAGVPLPVVGLGLLVGAGALVLGMAMFALGWVGGGDAKLMAACGVWLGLASFLPFLTVTAVAGGALALGLLYLRKLRDWTPAGAPAWLRRLLTPGESVPYGVAIAAGALLTFPSSPVAAALARASGQ
jgi:prepilin peptidase CpaA